MTKKGFTLIELMGIIIILSLISLLVVPAIDKSIKTFKQNAYNNQIDNIELAAKNWGSDNLYKYTFNDGDIAVITLGQLKIGGYLVEDLKNPITAELFADDMKIDIIKDKSNLVYYVEEESGTDPTTVYNRDWPNIFLNDEYIMRVAQNGVYNEPGVFASTAAGVKIDAVTIVYRFDNQVVSSINTANPGNYTVAYSASDAGLTRTIFRIVIVE